MRYFAPILIALMLGAASAPADAQPDRAREGVQTGDMRSLGEILNGIRRERPGSLADVQGPNMGPTGDPHYRLKWLTPDGRVLWLDTDARTGRVLGVEGDDRGGPPPGPPPGPRGRFGPFGERRGNFYPDGPPVGPPNGYQREYPGGIQRGLPPGYDRRPSGPPPGGFRNRGYDRGPPPEAGPPGRFRRFRDGR